MLATTLVRACGSARVMGASLLAGRRVRCRGAIEAGSGGEGPRRLGEELDAAVAQGADEGGADDGAVRVLQHSLHLLGVRYADADARVLGAVGAQAPDERAGGGIQFGALARDAHGRDR